VIASGEVASEERRQAVLAVIREEQPGLSVSDQITVSAERVSRHPEHERIDPGP
jgi:hypothetical protein